MSSKSRKPQSFLHGSLILIIATALVKIIGAIYKIPLYNILDDTGVGYYTTVYDLYTPMYTIAMAGLPIAISRIVAEFVSLEKYKDAKTSFRVAKRAMLVTGGAAFLIMCLLSYPYALYKNTLELIPCILSIAPCLLFCCVMSAYRGYYEGLRNMTPTAISQVIEAAGKLVFGLILAVVLLEITGSMTVAVCGSLMGITLGTAASSAYLVCKYRKTAKTDFTEEQLSLSPEPKTERQALKMVVLIALPIVLGSLVTQVTTLIDNLMITARLESAIEKDALYIAEKYAGIIVYNNVTNIKEELPIILYGAHRGLAFSVYNLVPVLTSVLGVSAIPVLTTAWAKKNQPEVKSSIETVIRTTALVSFPAAMGLIAMGKEIVLLLYSGKPLSAEIAGLNLCVLGVSAIFAGLTAPSTSMLQAIGKQKIPLYNIAVGAVLKIVINYILVGTPEVNIVGVPVGTAVCYGYICIMNIIMLMKYGKTRIDIFGSILKPIFAAALCGLTAFGVKTLTAQFTASNFIISVLSIAAAVAVYILCVILFKIIKKSDIISLPKGEKLLKVLEKLKVIG